MRKYLTLAKETMLEARDILMKHYYNEYDPRVNVDLEVEEFVSEKLLNKTPHHSFNGEETGLIERTPLFTWYFDPLSSPELFKERKEGFSMSLSLMEDKKVIFAIVMEPLHKEIYYAIKDEGAYLNEKRIETGDSDDLDYTYFSCSQKDNFAIILRLQKEFSCWHKGLLSHPLTFCHLARGDLSFCFLPIRNIHSSAAGLFIAKEAGAFLCDYYGNQWNLDSKNIVVCSNEGVYSKIKEYLNINMLQ